MKSSLFDKQFDFLLREFGEDIYLNNSPTRGILHRRDKGLALYTKEKLKAGDDIFYDNYYWYIMMEGSNNENYSGSVIGKAEWFVNIYPTALKNAVNLNFPKAVRMPAFLNQGNLNKVWDAVMPYVVGKLDFMVQSNPTTRVFEINDRFIKFGRAWKVTSKNESQAGFIKFSCEFEALGSGDNVELEIPANFDYYPTIADMSNGGAYPDARLNRIITPEDSTYNPDVLKDNYELKFEDINGYVVDSTKYTATNAHNIQYVKLYKDGEFITNLPNNDYQYRVTSSNSAYLSVRNLQQLYVPMDGANGNRPYGHTVTITAEVVIGDYTYSASHDYTTIKGD